MIRVDHAGEYGATRIYAGQLAVLGRGGKGDLLRHMQAQEQQHLSTFNDMIADRRVRPTAMLPLWHLAGFALGAVTAAMGEKAAMACTVAVEEAIDAHYAAQLETMDADDAGSARNGGEIPRRRSWNIAISACSMAPSRQSGYRLLSRAIKAGCRVAIAISERV